MPEPEEEPDTITCSDCGDDVSPDDVHDKYDDMCAPCGDDYFTCNECSDTTSNNDEETGPEGEPICSSCYSNLDYQLCDHCTDVTIDTNDAAYVTGFGYVCTGCRDYHYSTCESCTELVDNDNIQYQESSAEYRCNDCYEEEENGMQTRQFNSTIRGDDTRSHGWPTNLSTGFEFEVNNGSDDLQDALPTCHGLEGDSSISGNGIEIITQPARGKHIVEVVKEACDAARTTGWGVDKSCGLHVHIGGIPEEHLWKVINTFAAFEPIMYGMLPKSRKDGSYCHSIKQASRFTGLLTKSTDMRKWWFNIHQGDELTDETFRQLRGTKWGDSRYTGINLQSYFYRGTLEFRHHSGTLNTTKVIMWTKLIHLVTEFALKAYNQEVVRKALFNPPSDPRELLREMNRAIQHAYTYGDMQGQRPRAGIPSLQEPSGLTEYIHHRLDIHSPVVQAVNLEEDQDEGNDTIPGKVAVDAEIANLVNGEETAEFISISEGRLQLASVSTLRRIGNTHFLQGWYVGQHTRAYMVSHILDLLAIATDEKRALVDQELTSMGVHEPETVVAE